MKSSRIIILVATTFLCTSALAQKKLSYNEARAFYNALGKPIAQAALWNKKQLPERLKALDAARAFAEKGKSMFGISGDASACYKAAEHEKQIVIDLNDYALFAEGRREIGSFVALTSPLFIASVFGEHKAFCYQYVESLDTRDKK
jgi:hypothetical protein